MGNGSLAFATVVDKPVGNMHLHSDEPDSSGAPANGTLTVTASTTSAQLSASPVRRTSRGPSFDGLLADVLVGVVLALICFRVRKRKLLSLTVLGFALISGCGGGGDPVGTPQSKTGTVTVSTSTGSGISHNLSLTITVISQ